MNIVWFRLRHEPKKVNDMTDHPVGELGEQCIATREVNGTHEARQVEIMRITGTMFVDDYDIRYSRRTHSETTVRGSGAWVLRHRKDHASLTILKLHPA